MEDYFWTWRIRRYGWIVILDLLLVSIYWSSGNEKATPVFKTFQDTFHLAPDRVFDKVQTELCGLNE